MMAGVTSSVPVRTKSARRDQNGQKLANNLLASALLAIIVLSALFFGSVHAFSWGAYAVLLGLLCLWYSGVFARGKEAFRAPLRDMRGQLIALLLFCGFLIIQILPFGLLSEALPIASRGSVVVESNTISVAPDMTLLMLLRHISYGLFFFLMLQVCVNEGRRRLLTNILLVTVIGFAALGIVSLQLGDTVLGIPKNAYQGSATGSFVNRNSFATFLGFGAILALGKLGGLIVVQRQRHPHDGFIPGLTSGVLMYAIGYMVLIGTLVATQSRMGLFATLAASALMIAIIIWKSNASLRVTLVAGLAAVVAVAFGLVLFGESVFDRVVVAGQEAEQRSELYAQIWQLILQRPWTGFGGGSFELAFPLVHDYPVSTTVIWDRAHSTYLSLWSELGLVAGSLPILLLLLMAFGLCRGLILDRGNWMNQAVALCALVLGAIHSIVDFSLEIPANMFLLLGLLAIGAAAAHQNRT